MTGPRPNTEKNKTKDKTTKVKKVAKGGKKKTNGAAGAAHPANNAQPAPAGNRPVIRMISGEHSEIVILRPRETLLPYRSTASPIRGHRPKNRPAGNAICSKVRKSFERRELIDLNERRDPTKAMRRLVELGLKAKK
jgi:hypothetical protein